MKVKKIISEQLIEELQSYVSNPYGFILLTGKNGRGKSYCAMKVYEKLTPYRLPSYDHDLAWFINQANLNIIFTESIENYGSSRSLLKQACNSKLFVLDDLGTRPPAPAFLDFLYAIFDERWNQREKKGTIITTNLDKEGICKTLGNAIFSRIASGKIYTLIGDDRRLTETTM